MEIIIGNILKATPFIREKMKGHLGEILHGAAVGLVLRILGGIFGLGFNFLLARKIGADEAGLYFLSLSVVTLSMVVGKMGLDNTLLRFIASNASFNNWSAVKGVYSKSMKIAMGVSVTLSLFILFFSNWIAVVIFRKPELERPLYWMAFAIPPMAFLTLQGEALKGLKRIQDSVLVNGVLVQGISLVALFLIGNKWGATGATQAYLIACFFSAIIGFGFWRSAIPDISKLKGNFKNKDIFKSSMPLFWTSIFETLTSWMSIYFLGFWASKEEIGIYGTAFRTAMAVSLILVAVNNISAPKFAILFKKNKMIELDRTARQTAKLMILLASPLLLLFIFFPDFIMSFYGEAFRPGGGLLVILAVGQFVNVATGSVGYLLIMSGNERLVKIRAVFIAVLCFFLNLILVPRFGIYGAAISTTVCVILTNLIAVYFVWKKLKIFTFLPFSKIEVHENLNPFFIVGCPRSGTTLTSVILDRHSKLAIPPETLFFIKNNFLTFFSSDNHSLMVENCFKMNPRLLDLNLKKNDILNKFNKIACTPKNLFETIMTLYAKKNKKSRWGEKTPQHLQHLDLIFKWYPKAKVIVVVRDGRDNVISLQNVGWTKGENFWSLTEVWRKAIQNGERALAMWPKQIYILKFENLLTKPEKTVKQIMNFLGEKFEKKQLLIGNKSKVVPGWEKGWKGKAMKEIDPKRAYAWRVQIPKNELSKWNYSLSPEMKKNNYPDSEINENYFKIIEWKLIKIIKDNEWKYLPIITQLRLILNLYRASNILGIGLINFILNILKTYFWSIPLKKLNKILKFYYYSKGDRPIPSRDRQDRLLKVRI